MSTILHAVYDGEVLRPEEKVDLQPNTRYLIVVEAAQTPLQTADEATHPLTKLLELATDMGVTDLATNHDRYAHGKLGEQDDAAR